MSKNKMTYQKYLISVQLRIMVVEWVEVLANVLPNFAAKMKYENMGLLIFFFLHLPNRTFACNFLKISL